MMNMRPTIAAVVTAVALASTASAADPLARVSPIELTPAMISVIEDAIRGRLKDPEAARFHGIAGGTADADGIVRVCGLVNAKNAFGGYIGRQPFTGMLAQQTFIPILIGGDDKIQRATRDACEKMGLKLPQ
jgi:hypothetical protein